MTLTPPLIPASTVFDHVVIGAGAMGLATAWQLASRGARVLVLERFERHHTRGASHGSTRNLNNAYDEDAYLDLFDDAVALWRDLESGARTELLGLHGLVTHGDPDLVGAAREALVRRGARVSVVSADEAREQWAGMRFDGQVLVSHDAGVVRAERALDALEWSATARGAQIVRGAHVTGLEVDAGGDGVTLGVAWPDDAGVSSGAGSGAGFGAGFGAGAGSGSGSGAGASAHGLGHNAGEMPREIRAAHVIVTVGAWSSGLLDGIVPLPELTVTEEHPAHFRPRSGGLVWPSFNHLLPSDAVDAFNGNVYGMPSPGEGVKVGFHRVGPVIDPDSRTFAGTPDRRAALTAYVQEWFPGLDATAPDEISCTYTSTASGRFVLDRHGPVTVGAGFSGHGFKFVPAIGRVLADLATGVGLAPEPFRFAAH